MRAFLPDVRAPGREGSAAETRLKGVRRTFPGVTMFATDEGVTSLWWVLRAYALHDPFVG